MRRVLIVGVGLFGRLVAERLRESGVTPVIAARRGGDVRLDAEDEGSIAAVLAAGDVVVDTAGPFALRTTRLLRQAIDRGCDVVDLSESLAWSEAVLALAERARAAGSSVFAACSAVCAVTGACVRASGLDAPDRIDQFLAPASAETASNATRNAFARSLGRPIRTLREGRLALIRGFGETRAFPDGRRRGGLVEHAGTVLLPRAWPGLRDAEFWVDPNVPLARTVLTLAARSAPLAAVARAVAARIGPGPLGRRDGVFAVGVRQGARERAFTFSARRRSYLIAALPAAMVAESLARGLRAEPGVVLPDRQLDPDDLFERLRAFGIDVTAEPMA